MGYRRFINGGAIGFDLLCAERVLDLRARHDDARLMMVLPCATQSLRWSDKDSQRYEHLLYHADSVRVLSKRYFAGCMMVRNRYMVDRSAFCICYLNQPKGGTMGTVAYAMEKGLSILNTAIPSDCEAFIRRASMIQRFNP